jgi:uncharacterized protein YbjQ (UPF0145 family)
MGDFINLLFFIIFVAVGYFVGTMVEKKHYHSIQKRETKFLYLPAVTSKNLLDENTMIENAQLVYSSVVVSTDYFKLVLAGLRNLLGGEVTAYETLLDRGRREAVLRLKEQSWGANIILNLRIETSQINEMGSIEVLAYGTAIYYKIR